MAITTTISLQPLLFLKPLQPFPTRTTTLTFSTPLPKITIPPLRYTYTPNKKPYVLKTHATLFPSIPSNNSFSVTLAIVFAFTKTLVDILSLSFVEFKVPLLAFANGVGIWLEIYHSVMILRNLLIWFPNMPWEKQPFSAIRDLCDPCLSFFRTIVPPSDTTKNIDLSPLLATLVLGVLSNFLKTSPPRW